MRRVCKWILGLFFVITLCLGLFGGGLVFVPGWVLEGSSRCWPWSALVVLTSLLWAVLSRPSWASRLRSWRTERDAFRMLPGLVMALFFLAWVAAYAPAQLVVLVYKVGAICLTGYVAYWMYRTWLPHFRPSVFLASSWRDAQTSGLRIVEGQMVPFVVSGACEVAFVAACMIAVAVSL